MSTIQHKFRQHVLGGGIGQALNRCEGGARGAPGGGGGGGGIEGGKRWGSGQQLPLKNIIHQGYSVGIGFQGFMRCASEGSRTLATCRVVALAKP